MIIKIMVKTIVLVVTMILLVLLLVIIMMMILIVVILILMIIINVIIIIRKIITTTMIMIMILIITLILMIIVTTRPNLPYIVRSRPHRPHGFVPSDVSPLISLTSKSTYNRSTTSTTHKALTLNARFRCGISQSPHLKTSHPRL
jgi:hypothetical protein